MKKTGLVDHNLREIVGVFFSSNNATAISYEKYEQRPNYYLVTGSVNKSSSSPSDSSTYSYIIRQNATNANCSSDAKFPGDVSIPYYLVVSKPPTLNILVAIFAMNIAVTILLTLVDVGLLVKLWLPKKDHDMNKKKLFCSLVEKFFLKVWQLATIVAPTYYISAIDYSEICLRLTSVFEIAAISMVPIAAALPLAGLLGILLGCARSCCIKRECTCNCRLYDSIPQKDACKLCCCMPAVMFVFYGCLLFAFIFTIGFFLCIMMVIKQAARKEGVMIIANLLGYTSCIQSLSSTRLLRYKFSARTYF